MCVLVVSYDKYPRHASPILYFAIESREELPVKRNILQHNLNYRFNIYDVVIWVDTFISEYLFNTMVVDFWLLRLKGISSRVLDCFEGAMFFKEELSKSYLHGLREAEWCHETI